ncbi:MAG TPA: FAD-binding oxidoreductase, partial [Acidimicrobiales bacterium]|nr:FAD-binding oxidoreductase [Acidimicrobiales bacterium]
QAGGALSRRDLLGGACRAALAAASLGLAGAAAAACAGPGQAARGPSGPRRTTAATPGTGAGSATTEAAPATTTSEAAPATTTSEAATTTTTLAEPATLAELAGVLHGQLVLPADSDYQAASQVYDLRYAGATPIAIAYCESADDVARCIGFATAHGIAPIPRCGGHSYGGYSTGSGLVVDVSAMSATSFDAASSSAVVGAGTRLVDLYGACAAAGALIPGGSCPTVGIAGLALGGGIGVLGRRYGLTCDNLLALELVSAEGRILTCSAESEPELFWACRGGGGRNFGIVTSFTFATHPIPQLTLFTLEWPWSQAPAVLAAWQSFMDGAPDELWSNCQLLYEGTAGPHVRSSGVFAGSATALTARLAAFAAAAGAPSYHTVDTDTYLRTMLVEGGCDGLSVPECHLQGSLPGQAAAGTLSRAMFSAKSAYVASAMPEGGVSAAVSAIDSLQSAGAEVGAGLVLDAYGGAINAVPAEATAFVHRDALFAVEMSMSFSPDAAPESVTDGSGWLSSTAAALAPYCDGQAYQNYIDPTLSGWEEAYYGANLARLVKVKRAYDPDDVFSFAQSIPLSS